jgi:hypothetical protein
MMKKNGQRSILLASLLALSGVQGLNAADYTAGGGTVNLGGNLFAKEECRRNVAKFHFSSPESIVINPYNEEFEKLKAKHRKDYSVVKVVCDVAGIDEKARAEAIANKRIEAVLSVIPEEMKKDKNITSSFSEVRFTPVHSNVCAVYLVRPVNLRF